MTRLENLSLGKSNFENCDLSTKSACDLVWSILQKAKHLQYLCLPNGLNDMEFTSDHIEVAKVSYFSKEFMKYFISSKLILHLKDLGANFRIENSDSDDRDANKVKKEKQFDQEAFDLFLTCILESVKLR